MKTLNRSFIIGVSALGFALSGCGSEQYQTPNYSERQTAPGTFTIPAKVDVVVAVDDTSSMSDVNEAVRAQIPAFLQGLESSGWDYRFTAIPLTKARSISQIAASRYDGNWNSLGGWMAPYPGASPTGGSNVLSGYFRIATPGQRLSYSDYVTAGSNAGTGLHEPGLRNLIDALRSSSMSASKMIRSDAMLVVIPFSTGEDTSDLTYTTSGCGTDAERHGVHPAEYAQYNANCAAQMESTYQRLAGDFAAVKQRALVRMFAAVSARRGACQGDSNAYIGSRYARLAKDFGGRGLNICTSSISSVMNEISGELVSTRLNMTTRYLVVDRKPNASTVVVTATRGGVKEAIAKDDANGWSLIESSGPITVNTVELDTADGPIGMTQATGYVIKLNGSSVLKGDDTAEVKYEPAK